MENETNVVIAFVIIILIFLYVAGTCGKSNRCSSNSDCPPGYKCKDGFCITHHHHPIPLVYSPTNVESKWIAFDSEYSVQDIKNYFSNINNL